MTKVVKFLSKNQGVVSLSLIITIGKTSTVKNLEKHKFLNFSEKEKSMVVSRGNQRVILIHYILRISRLTGYIYQSRSCLGIMRMVAEVNVPRFKKTGVTKNKGSAKIYPTIWLDTYYTEK